MPMVPPAPGRFSTSTCWPSAAESLSATGRAMVSVAEPGVKGTMMRMGLEGNDCAIAAAKLEQTEVLGTGFGGFIAVALAARHGARIRRLIAAPALAAFPEPAKQPLRALAERVAKEGMAGALDVAIRRMFPAPFIAA